MNNNIEKQDQCKSWIKSSNTLFVGLVLSLILFTTTLTLFLSINNTSGYLINKIPVTLFATHDISSWEDLNSEITSINGIERTEIDELEGVIYVYLKKNYEYSPGKLEVIIESLQATDGVTNIYVPKILKKVAKDGVPFLYKLSGTVFLLSTIIILVFLLFIIKALLKIHKTDFLNMKLIGATNQYIQEPVLFKAFWFSLLAGLMVAIIVATIYYIGVKLGHNINLFISLRKLYIIIASTIFFGIIAVMSIARITLCCMLKEKKKQ